MQRKMCEKSLHRRLKKKLPCHLLTDFISILPIFLGSIHCLHQEKNVRRNIASPSKIEPVNAPMFPHTHPHTNAHTDTPPETRTYTNTHAHSNTHNMRTKPNQIGSQRDTRLDLSPVPRFDLSTPTQPCVTRLDLSPPTHSPPDERARTHTPDDTHTRRHTHSDSTAKNTAKVLERVRLCVCVCVTRHARRHFQKSSLGYFTQ